MRRGPSFARALYVDIALSVCACTRARAHTHTHTQQCTYKDSHIETSLVVQWLKQCTSMQGPWVQSLVKEIRSHVPCAAKVTNKKITTYT